MPSAWCCACLAVLAVARARCGAEEGLQELPCAVQEQLCGEFGGRKSVDLQLLPSAC